MSSRVLRRIAITTAALTGTSLYIYTRKTRQFKSLNDPTIPKFVRNTPPTREESLQQLLEASDPAKPLDVLIVGGGATGTGIALDLASRGGLKVGLVEMNDFASETSSRSTKLIHGGVRYLEKAVFGLDPMQLKLVFEALKERAVVCHQAPFLVRPIETIIPCYRPYDLALFWCGMKTYDLLAAIGGGVIGGLSGFSLPVTTLNNYPHLKHIRKGDTLLGAVTYYDGQHWDARLCLHVALTAGCYGAAVVNHCKLIGVNGSSLSSSSSANVDAKKGADDASAAAPAGLHKVVVQDTLTSTKHTVYARTLVNATGPFSDTVRQLTDADHKPLVRPSHGSHITLPAKYAPKDRAMLVPSTDGRVVFCINYQGHCIAGTTDVETTVQEAPRAPEKDVQFILDNLRPLLGDIDRSEVLSTWCGIRPLAAPEPKKGKDGAAAASSSQSIVREHSIAVSTEDRTLSITGGKWTTYRKMAEDVVHALMDKELIDKARMGITTRHSPTEDIVLYGAQNFDPTTVALHVRANVPFGILDHWRGTYGDNYEALFNLALELGKGKKEPPAGAAGPTATASATAAGSTKKQTFVESAITTGKLQTVEDESQMLLPMWKLNKLCPHLPVVEVDVVYSSRHESCERVQDFIARRSAMAFLNVAETREAIPKIAEIMAKEKKWNGARKAAEIADGYRYLETFTPTF